MLREILDDVKAKGFTIKQIMDHDTSGANKACISFPEVRITYCEITWQSLFTVILLK